MAQRIDIGPRNHLSDYAAVAHLAPDVQQLVAEAARVAPRLEGRTVWMVNSTAQGGGVAEMLPTMVALLRDLGIATEWAVIDSDDTSFFRLTKRLHNLIHGVGEPGLGAADRETYEATNRANAGQIGPWLKPGDILVVHDPQPMPLARMLCAERELRCVWRCHIGLDDDTEATRSAWDFLAPYAAPYRRGVFSAPEYIPESFASNASIIFPAINPLTPKNLELTLHKMVGILANSGLAASPGPLLPFPYAHLAERLQSNGVFAPASLAEDIGLLNRPIVAQISRWDRLKGFLPLMEGFIRLKRRNAEVYRQSDPVHRRRLDLVRLVMAGPDPSSIQDDPEGQEVFSELCAAYLAVDPALQDDIALVTLPMRSVMQNSLMVNALQRAASIVVQNSLREGFGLTITEAMWKRVPVLSNRRACGPRQQVRDGIDGRLVNNPEDPEAIARVLDEMLADAAGREAWGRSGQRRVHQEFMIFGQIRAWLRLLEQVV